MKKIWSFLFWLSSSVAILAAHFTQIGFLVTIATALYWILAITLPVCVLILFILTVSSDDVSQAYRKSWPELDSFKFYSGMISSFISLGIYAVVGWAWPFAMLMVIVVLVASLRFNTEVK